MLKTGLSTQMWYVCHYECLWMYFEKFTFGGCYVAFKRDRHSTVALHCRYIAIACWNTSHLICLFSATTNCTKPIDVEPFSHRSGQRWPWAAWWVWRVYPAPDGGRGPAALSRRRTVRQCSASARAPACSLVSSPPSRATGMWPPPPERGRAWRSAPGGCPIDRQQRGSLTMETKTTEERKWLRLSSSQLLCWCGVQDGHTCVCTDDTAWTSRLKSPLWLSIHLTGGAWRGHF